MSVRFLDERSSKLDDDAAEMESLGVILFRESGDWHAARHHDGTLVSGPGSLKSIPKGFWISNSLYEDQYERQQEMKSCLLRSDGWMRMPIDELRSAWGLSDHQDRIAVKVIAASCGRAFRLIQETLAAQEALRTGDFQGLIRKVQRSSSLAMGLNALQGAELSALVPPDPRMRDHFSKTWQSGMYAGSRKSETEEGFLRLVFSFPAFSYLKSVTAGDIPAMGRWQEAVREDHASTESFIRELSKMNRPAIYRAHWDLDAAGAPDHFVAFANKAKSDATYRSRWTEDELPIMQKQTKLTIEGAIVGEKWQRSPTGKLISDLETCAGGPMAASLSWSVGLAAHNIMASGLRFPRKDAQYPTSEAIWLSARDRAAMYPAVVRLCQAGGRLISAQSGVITIEVPKDSEILMIVAQEAWEIGMHMTMRQVALLEDHGVPLPTEPGLFGGSEADCMFAITLNGKRRNALWRMDSVLDMPPEKREKAIMKLIGEA